MTTSTIQPGMRAALVPASPHTPIAVINGTPVYAIQGGRSGGVQIFTGDDDGTPDDDLLDEDDDDAEDDDEDEDADEPDDDAEDAKPTRRKTEDSTAALKRMEEALAKANRTAAKNRRAGKVMERLGIEDLPTWLTERGIDPETGKPYGDDVVDPDDEADLYEPEPVERPAANTKAKDRETVRAVRAAAAAAEARAREMYVPILAQQAATLALREAGFTGDRKKMDKILRLIDPNDLDVVLDGDEFEIEGMDEAIAGIQEDFPELFRGADDDEPPARRRTATKTTGTGRAPARRATGARDVDGGERGRPKAKPGTWMDQLVQQMDKRGR